MKLFFYFACKDSKRRKTRTMANRFVCTRNSRLIDGFSSAKEMLTTLPRGAYTTGRTVDDGAAVFQLEFHLNRYRDLALTGVPVSFPPNLEACFCALSH